MYSLKSRKFKVCLLGMLVSLAALLIVFFVTDGLLGDKEFFEYTRDDWKLAAFPLALMGLSCAGIAAFALALMIPLFAAYPALVDYAANRKFAEVDAAAQFLVFDHHELERACCRGENKRGLWISVQEYDLKARRWVSLEDGRCLEDAGALPDVLRSDYGYDRLKYCDPSGSRWW